MGLFEGYAGGSVIENNVVTGARTGILIIDGYEQNNIFTEGDIVIRSNRTYECLNGFFLYKNKYNQDPNRLNILLEENSFIRESGVTAKIEGRDESSYGIRLFPRTSGVTLRSNAVSGCKYGVFVSSPAKEIVVEGNVVQNTTYGISCKRNEHPQIGLQTKNNTFIHVKTQEKEW